MAEAYSLSVWPSSLALESKLSRNLESHTGLVPRLSHHEWKNLKNHSSVPYINIPTEELWRSRFSWFFLDEKVSLKGITVFVGRLLGDWGLQSRHQMCLRPHKGEQITICDGGGETLAHKQTYNKWR